MSTPAIYIELQGTTSRVPPRYTRPTRSPCAPHAKPMCAPRPRNLMVRYSRFPICHTEFGIRNSRIGNREIG